MQIAIRSRLEKTRQAVRPSRRSVSLRTALILLPLTLFLRWGPLTGNWGEQLTPWPDAAEYVAGAQSMAESGRYFLQVGPWEVQPRYPPGLSLWLTPAVLLGVAGDQLWRLAALFEWGVVSILAFAVRALVLRWAPGERRIATAAALGAALTWLLSPMLSTHGSFVTSDQPALLAALFCGLCLFKGQESGFRRPVWLVGAGLGAGVSASMRPIEGALLLLALTPLAAVLVRQLRWRRALLVVSIFTLGLAAPLLINSWILERSGFPAGRWSTYRYWEPQNFHSLGRIFSLRHAIHGNVPFWKLDESVRPVPNLVLAGQVLFGIPGRPVYEYLGYFWPGIALLAAVGLGARLLARPARAGPWTRASVVALALWGVLHILLTLLFVWPAPRLLLALLFVVTLAYWISIGVAGSRTGAYRLAAGAAAALALASGIWLTCTRATAELPTADRNSETRTAVAAWLVAMPASARDNVPFDTVRAQALGLLGRSNLDRVAGWGRLGESWHFKVLQKHGYVCFQKGYGWNLDDSLRPAEGRNR